MRNLNFAYKFMLTAQSLWDVYKNGDFMKKRTLKATAAVCGMLAMSLAFGGTQAKAAEGTEKINKGVIIGTVEVSGMTAEEAKQAVQTEVDKELENEIKLSVGSSEVVAEAKELGMTWENSEVVEEAIGLGKSGNIVKRYKDNKDLENKNKTFEITYTANQDSIKSYLQKKKSELDCEAVDGSLTRENGEFVMVPGVIGVELDVDKSATKVYNYMNTGWNGDGGSIDLEAKEVKPRGTEEELAEVKDVLGTATTYYGSTYQRNTNVEVGAAKLDGTVLYPGDSFSVTEAVIPFNAENGYELAPSYESGKVVDTYGGGICQVSTTLYNALLKSELEILERHNHTMTVSYVDPSKDAAIAEGLMDLQFANNTDHPIYIEGYGYGGELTFTVYGKEYRSEDRSVYYESETVSVINPEGVKLYAKADANVGYISQIQSSHTGMEARLWKYVTVNGETTSEQVNKSSYQAVPVSYEVGIASSDANLVAQLQTAIANNDLATVQKLIAGGSQTPESESETQATEAPTQATEAPTQAPETQAPTQAPETQPPTQAPETQAPTDAPPAGEDDLVVVE